MIDTNDFEYRDKPTVNTKQFNIHILSDQGVNEYFGSNSYLHSFAGRLNKRTLRKLDQLKDFNQTSQTFYKPTKAQVSFKPDQETNTDKINLKEPVKVSEACVIEDNNNQAEDVTGQDNNIEFYNNTNNFTNLFQTKRANLNSARNLFYKKLEADRDNCPNQRYPNAKFNNSIINLKTKLNTTGAGNKSSQNFWKVDNSRVKTGFESFHVPRLNEVDILQQSKTAAQTNLISRYTDRIAKSVGFRKVDNSESRQERINETNIRLNGVLSDQLNRQYLNASRLPKISLIINQPRLEIKRTRIGNSKLMGGKYNPSDYFVGNGSTQFGRNYYGALYQH